MRSVNAISRRSLLGGAACALAAGRERIIDIHQHTNYSGRTDEQLIAHQQRNGITRTVLLPAGSKYGLAVGAGGNDSVAALGRRLKDQFSYFANELPGIPETKAVLEKYLSMGAIGIGEQKFHVDCDSAAMRLVAEIAREHKVPVLMHIQHDTYNLHFERFYRMLEAYPAVNFIGHAQTFWGNIDKNHQQAVLYPKGPVTPGGITDRLLSDYPNMWGDLSAGSALNAMLRDEEHARGFLERHQDRLMFGSDCNDTNGHDRQCVAHDQQAALRRLAPNETALRKIFYQNASKLLRIT